MASFILLLLFAIFSVSLAFSPICKKLSAVKFDGLRTLDLLKPAPFSALFVPSIALADGIDSSPVLIPLVISALTIIPFYFYSQALKPKPRTVQQIELDANLRPKDKKLNQGKVTQATAAKKGGKK